MLHKLAIGLVHQWYLVKGRLKSVILIYAVLMIFQLVQARLLLSTLMVFKSGTFTLGDAYLASFGGFLNYDINSAVDQVSLGFYVALLILPSILLSSCLNDRRISINQSYLIRLGSKRVWYGDRFILLLFIAAMLTLLKNLLVLLFTIMFHGDYLNTSLVLLDHLSSGSKDLSIPLMFMYDVGMQLFVLMLASILWLYLKEGVADLVLLVTVMILVIWQTTLSPLYLTSWIRATSSGTPWISLTLMLILTFFVLVVLPKWTVSLEGWKDE